MIELVLIIFAAILPAFLLVLYIWWRDKYQREPFSQVARGVLFGVAAAGIAACIEFGIQWLGIVSTEPMRFGSAIWTA